MSHTIRVTRTVRVHTTFDVVAFFAALTPVQRRRYENIDLYEYGFEDEYQRPAAYLMAHVVDNSETHVDDQHAQTRSDEADLDFRVLTSGTDRTAEPWEWHQSDFDALAVEVPWLRDVYDTARAAAGELSPDEARRVALRPGPLDVPLPL